MKIVYSILGTYNSGGMERVLSNKANYLAALGYEVVIITTDQRGRESNFFLHQNISQIDLGINYTDDHNLSLLHKIFSYRNKQRIHRRELTEILEKLKADIVISMFDHDVTFLHQIKDGSKKVLEIHFSRYKRIQYNTTGLSKVINIYRMKQDLSLAKKYERFVVLTQEDSMNWKGLDNIIVIPNAHTFWPSKKASLIRKRAIAVGRFDYQKGFDDLIKAWKIIAVKYPEWKLDIYGEGPLKQKMKFQIYEMHLSNHIFLHNPIKNIMKAYMNSGIVLMTSRYEGLPMVLLEAQACGLPVVSYACKCGPRDIISENKNGFLVAEGDIVGFADKVCLLLGDDLRRMEMGRRAREMSRNFSEERIMKHWLKLFETIRKERHVS